MPAISARHNCHAQPQSRCPGCVAFRLDSTGPSRSSVGTDSITNTIFVSQTIVSAATIVLQAACVAISSAPLSPRAIRVTAVGQQPSTFPQSNLLDSERHALERHFSPPGSLANTHRLADHCLAWVGPRQPGLPIGHS